MDRYPGALLVLHNLARFDFAQINGNRKEIISHLCFKKEHCLTGRNNTVRLPPTVLQIQDVGRWANYLWCIIIVSFGGFFVFFLLMPPDMWVRTRYSSLLWYGHQKPHWIKYKIQQGARLESHSLGFWLGNLASILDFSHLGIKKMHMFFKPLQWKWIEWACLYFSSQVQHGFRNRYACE